MGGGRADTAPRQQSKIKRRGPAFSKNPLGLKIKKRMGSKGGVCCGLKGAHQVSSQPVTAASAVAARTEGHLPPIRELKHPEQRHKQRGLACGRRQGNEAGKQAWTRALM